MGNRKKNARTIGILYIIGTAAGILSVPFLKAENPSSLTMGAILELVMGIALAMIPAFVYPVLKAYSQAAGMGYVVFRGALETCTYIMKAACILALSSLGAVYAAGGQGAAQLTGAGAALKALADSSVTVFFFGAGALIFYTALYKYRLIPRWISGFGIAAVLLHIASGSLVLLGLQENFDIGSLMMNLPIAVQEMMMAVWLITKGFRCEDKLKEAS